MTRRKMPVWRIAAVGLFLVMWMLNCGGDEGERTGGATAGGEAAEEYVEFVDLGGEGYPAPTPANQRLDGYRKRLELQRNSLLKNVAFRSAGPTVMSGRAADIDANPADPTHFYVAYASGGLWKTENNGMSFAPLFDDQAVMTIGDIAVNWGDHETIWVGTGECNASRSSYSGTGVYKSTDGGKSWQHLGLEETHHIGRIVLHPENPDIAWVAALGHLYSFNAERGVYKTTDGGKSWRKTLFINDTTGVVDLVIDPNNPDVLYAAAWQRMRYAWNFIESGSGSGIYKSTDGGETWVLLTQEGSGFPTGAGAGRIGLALSPEKSQTVYAVIDNQFRRPKKEKKKTHALTKDMLRSMSREDFLKLSEADLTAFLDENRFPQKYTAKDIIERVRNNKLEPVALVTYLEDANAQLFDTPVIGAEVYRSEDGGKTWQRTHEKPLDGVYFSYGYYFGIIRVAAGDPERIYILGVPILKSDDGGKTFTSIGEANVHSDHHALWVDPNRTGHLINGNDGGLNISYDDGKTWFKANTPAVGQYYDIAIDMAKPYNVYGGLQDNGVWYGPSTYKASLRWTSSGNYPYKMLIGGDGMQVQVDFRDNNTVYAGSQFGYYARVDKRTGKRQRVKPQHELGERPLRFNWQSPIKLSRHNQDILYFGTHRVYRSMDRGETYQPISGDLTQGGRRGDVPYGTLTALDESPLQFGLLYAGSDDGLVHVTRDGGFTWTRISDDLPQNLWVSRVCASKYDTGTVYVSLNGYRFDDFTPYLYRSRDFGRSWEKLGTALPAEPINVVAEDPENRDILYVGTDHAIYVSLDGGGSFMSLFKNLPPVPVHDLLVHPRDHELVVGTHGRSVWIANVAHVQQLTREMLAKLLHVFKMEPVTYSESWGRQRVIWRPASEPEREIAYFAGRDGTATLRVKTPKGLVLHEMTDEAEHGLNYVTYHLTVDSARVAAYNAELEVQQAEQGKKAAPFKPLEAADNGKFYLRPGTYTIAVSAAGTTVSQTLQVKKPKRRKRGAGQRPGVPAVPAH